MEKSKQNQNWKEILGFGPASEYPLAFHQAQDKRAFKMNFQSITQ